jgi:transforming growth factor-beta-induced protein
MKQSLTGVIAAAAIGVFGLGTAPVFAAGTDASSLDTGKSASNIVQIAASDPDLSTLVTALTDAGLVTTLEGAGPFTVFAPTNEAFAKLPTGLLNYVLANKSVLKTVLLYHVASRAGTLSGDPIETVQGEKVFPTFDYNTSGLAVEVNNSWVSGKPIKASNGVIYIIDSVLMPQFE